MSGAGPDKPALSCAVRRTSLIGLIEVAGVLRLDTTAQLRETVLKLAAEGAETLVLDLADVEVDDGFLADGLSPVVFSTLGRMCADRTGNDLLLAVPDPRLRETMQRVIPLFVQVFATCAEACFAAEHRVTSRRICEQIPATPYSSRLARQLVDEVCLRWKLRDELHRRAQIVVTELVTNAVLHVGGPIELVITVRRYVLRLEVSDHSTVPPQLQEPPEDATSGRGLSLVTKLTSNWGVSHTTWGKTVWADLVLRASARR